jgi:hypothetical protein
MTRAAEHQGIRYFRFDPPLGEDATVSLDERDPQVGVRAVVVNLSAAWRRQGPCLDDGRCPRVHRFWTDSCVVLAPTCKSQLRSLRPKRSASFSASRVSITVIPRSTFSTGCVHQSI